MPLRCRLLGLAVLLVFFASSCLAQLPPEAVRRAKEATAFVTVQVRDGEDQGSAFCIDAAGLFVTNAHVVEDLIDGGKLTLVLRSGEKNQLRLPARVVKLDKEDDLAILQVTLPEKIGILALGTTDELAETDSVTAFGYPFGSDLATKDGDFPSISVSVGHISSLRKLKGELSAIQMDASINPGNSGGPVLNVKGEVIGIVHEGIPGAAVNFAIPVGVLQGLLRQLVIAFTPPMVVPDHLADPVEFRIRLLTPPKSGGAVTVHMTLSAEGDEPRNFQATSTDGRIFTFNAPLMPIHKGPAQLQLVLTSGDNRIEGTVADQKFRVGFGVVSLSGITRIDGGPDPSVTLSDNRLLHGTLTGVGAVEIQIGSAHSTVDLTKFDTITVTPAAPPVSVGYRITAMQDGATFGDLKGSIPLSERAADATAGRGSAIWGEIVISCFDSNDIRRFEARTGAYLGVFAVGNGLRGPRDMLWGRDGNLYVSCAYTNSVRRFNGRSGQFMDAFVNDGGGGLDNPNGMAWGADGNLYVASNGSREVKRYNGRTGAFMDNFISRGSGNLERPSGVRFGPDGNLYISSQASNVVKRYNGKTGEFMDDFAGGNGVKSPGMIEFGPDGRLYVCSYDTSEVKRFDSKTGAYIDTFISTRSGGLDSPCGLLFGPDGKLYVSGKTSTIKRYDGRSGAYLGDFIGGDGMVYPQAMLTRRRTAGQ